MTMNTKAFINLLQCGLWGRKADCSLFTKDTNWETILEMAKQQAVIAITFDGLTMLAEEKWPPEEFRMKWLALVVNIEQQNERVNREVANIFQMTHKEQLHAILLKGQGTATFYQQPLHRQSGDIDLFFPNAFEKSNQLFRNQGCEVANETDKHVDINWNSVLVENHHKMTHWYNQEVDQKIQEVINQWSEWTPTKRTIQQTEADIPHPLLNIFYTFLHAYHHFLLMGVGLRQLCDLAILVNYYRDEVDWDLLLHAAESCGYERGIQSFYYVMVKYIGLRPVIWNGKELFCRYGLDQRGERFFADCIRGGNFGFYGKYHTKKKKSSKTKQLIAIGHAVKRSLQVYHYYPQEIRSFLWTRLKQMT